jgi:4-diphosphocytidyl-2C-methyl-D-erythritol kinase
VREVREWLAGREGVLGALVAGSGASVFGLCESKTAACRAAEAARERGWWSEATATTGHGVRLVEETG